MMKKNALLHGILFCSILLSVPVVQLVHELTKKERIQACDILYDTFVTPGVQRKQVKDGLAHVLALCDSIRMFDTGLSEEDYRYECAEELLAEAENTRRHYSEYNRYVTDSLREGWSKYDSLVVQATSLRDAVDAENMQDIARALAQCGKIVGDLLPDVSDNNLLTNVSAVIRTFFTTTFFNRTYIRAYEKQLEDRSFIAAGVRPFMQFIRYKVLADPGEKAILGKKNWLFYRPGVEYLYRPSVFDPRSRITDYNDKPLTDNPIEAILDFRDQLSDRDIDLLIVVVPGKTTVYPDYFMGPPGCRPEKTISQTTEFIDSLNAHGITAVDLFGPLVNERRNDLLHDELLYLSIDTHWKSRALRLSASLVAERIRLFEWYVQPHATEVYSLDTVTVDREGDVGVMTDLASNPYENLRITFPLEQTRCFKVMKHVFDSAGILEKRVAYRDDYKNSRILVIGDSFSRIYQTDAPGSAGFIAHIASELAEPMASVVSDGGASTLVREKLARHSVLLKGKKLVVWEFIERDIRFGANGWKKVTMQ